MEIGRAKLNQMSTNFQLHTSDPYIFGLVELKNENDPHKRMTSCGFALDLIIIGLGECEMLT